MQLLVIPVKRYQFIMGTTLHNMPVMQNTDFIGMFDGTQSMRNSHRGTCLHQPEERILYQTLTLCVKGRGSLIKNQDGRILQNGTCNRNALTLSTGKTTATVTDIRIITMFHSSHEIVGIGNLSGILHLYLRCILHTEGDVILNGIVEKDSFLIHVSNEFP